MKLELRNLKINLAFSEETTMFMADLYVDGVKCGYAQNDGRGGCTYINPYEGKRELLHKAEQYAQSLPSKTFTYAERTIEIKSTLDGIVDEIVAKKADEKERAKAEKKIQKLTKDSIVWGVPNANSYKYLKLLKKGTIEELIADPMYKKFFETSVANVRAKLQKDEVIFNTNLNY